MRRLIQYCLYGLTLAAMAHGAGLDYLAKQADAIVVGSVQTRTEGANHVAFRLTVIRALHGLVPGLSVAIAHEGTGLVRGPERLVEQSLTGMWFLKRNTDGTWDVLPSRPSMHPSFLSLFLPAFPAPPPQARANADLTALLIEEIIAARRAGIGFDAEVLAGALDGVRPKVIEAVAPSLLTSDDPSIVAVALAAMLDAQTSDAIPQLTRLWGVIRALPESKLVKEALRDQWRDATPGVAKRLVDLARSDAELRPAIGVALAAIHTREALPLLAELVFEDNPQSQLAGMYGLSAFANGCPVKTRDNVASMAYLICTEPTPYKTDNTRNMLVFRQGPPEQHNDLVLFWRKWWETHPDLH